MKLRGVYDPEDMMRYGLMLKYGNGEGPKSFDKFEKNLQDAIKKKKIITVTKMPFFSMSIIPNGLSSIVTEIPKIDLPSSISISVLQYFDMMLSQITHKENIVAILTWATGLPAYEKVKSGGSFRPLLYLVRELYYGWAGVFNEKENTLIINVNGLNLRSTDINTPDQLMTDIYSLLAYINRFRFNISLFAFNITWYKSYLQQLNVIYQPSEIDLRKFQIRIDNKDDNKDDNKENKEKEKGATTQTKKHRWF